MSNAAQSDPLSSEGLTGIERLFGVIGWPVAHSMSPAIHNAAFAAAGLPYRYRLMPVAPTQEAFDAFLARCGASGVPVRGCSVTIPHKQHALAWLEEVGGRIEPLAARIGAVNTLAFETGGVYGANTDYAAAVEAIADALGGREKLAGKRALLLGAGGAGRAIAFGLTAAGCHVHVADLDEELAQKLAEATGAQAVSLGPQLGKLAFDVIANATPVGMHPNVDRSPLPADLLKDGMVVFDAVYNPLHTKLLTNAGRAGCRTVSGVEMFIGQAVAQFELWTGRSAPREVMRSVVLERLRRPGS